MLGAKRVVIVLVILVDDETLEIFLIQKLHVGNVSASTNDCVLANFAEALDVREARKRSVGSYIPPSPSACKLQTSTTPSIIQLITIEEVVVGNSEEELWGSSGKLIHHITYQDYPPQ